MYDTIIIGAGPAGLTASLYCSCFHLKNLVIGKILGGQMSLAPEILNYPGFLEISGKELTDRMVLQAKARNGEVVEDSVTSIEKNDASFLVKTESNAVYEGLSIILATGTERRKLNIPGENEYMSKGVHYCVTCERQDYSGKVVAIVGGGNASIQGAVQLAHLASKVIILLRGKDLKCDPIWKEQIEQYKNIEMSYDTKILEILGDGQKLTGIKIVKENTESTLQIEKLFIEIGGVPGTALVSSLGVSMDTGGYIKVDNHLATNITGVFAAGDLVSYGLSIEQISTAVGLGARAAASVFSFLKQSKAPSSWGSALIQRNKTSMLQ